MGTWLLLALWMLALNVPIPTLDLSGDTMPYVYEIRPQQYFMKMMELQEQMDAAKQQEYLTLQEEEQKNIIIEGFFDRTKRLGKINYALGCVWAYTPKKRDDEEQRWKGCWAKSFDCSGLLRAYGMWKGIFNQEDIDHNNSTTLFTMGKQKDPREAKRGDFVYFDAIEGSAGSGVSIPNHIGIVPKDFSGNWLWILDNLDGTVEERALNTSSCNKDYCTYIWKYRIYVASNGFVEVARQRDIIVKKYIDDRSIVDARVKKYLSDKRVGQYADSFITYGKQFNIKPEMAVCIAVSETGLGKNMYATWNIGNVQSHQGRQFVNADGTPDWDRGIKAIYEVALNGQYLINKKIVWDLYTNGQCKTDCNKYYASGKSAQDNILKCLSVIYNQKVDPEFQYRY